MSSTAQPPSEKIVHALPQVFLDTSLPIIVEDLDGLVISMNPAAEEAYGWTNEELIGLPIKTIVPSSHHPQADELLSRCRSGETVRDVEGLRERRDGKLIPVLLTLSLLSGENQQQYIASMATDITALKAAEERLLSHQDALEERVAERTTELRSALQELHEARLSADLANSAKSEFLAKMSHEIRTPMNAILGMTHLCLETELSPKQRGYLGKIERATLDLLGLVNDILDFSKIEAGKLQLEEVLFSLDDLLEKQRDLFGLQAAKKDIELIFSLESGVQPLYSGDPLRLGQILINLLSNALKFTERGQVMVSVSPGRQAGLCFRVSDTGIGVDESILDSLFESFHQFDASTTRRYGGTGLGLAICRQLVQMMGGEIGAASSPGRGSEFWFDVPLKGHPDRRREDLPVGKTAVLIESHPVCREAIAKLVGQLGWGVHAYESVAPALRAMKKELAPDAILISEREDLNLEALIRMQRGCPILHLTKFATHQAPIDSVKSLQRPLTRSLLREKLGELLMSSSSSAKLEHNKTRLAERFRDLEGTCVLVVEDNFINREVLREMLSHIGAEVVEAESGEESLRLVEEHDFDIILMDIQMPGIDGLEAAKRLRSMGQTSPILAVSANTAPWEGRNFREAGMDGFLGKPILPFELYSALRKFLSNGVLDKDFALRSLLGNEALYHQLVARLFEDAKMALPVLELGRGREALKHAHDLGSTALFLGMSRLGKAARGLEKTLRSEAPFRSKVEALREALAITMDSYYCRRGESSLLDSPKKVSDRPVPDVTLLKAKLASGEVEAIEMARAWVDSRPLSHRRELQELLTFVEAFEFERALDWLENRPS